MNFYRDNGLTYCKKLWMEFGNVPMNPETECIEEEWNGFPPGTRREVIWHWFEDVFDVKVYDLMYGNSWGEGDSNDPN